MHRVGLILAILALLAAYSVIHATGAGYSRVRVPVDPLVVALAAGSVLALRRLREHGSSSVDTQPVRP